MNLDLDNIGDFKMSDLLPWTFSQSRVLFSSHNDKKSQTDPLVFRTKFHELLSDFPNYEYIFTDGSGGGRVVRWCWVNFQCRGVLQF